MNRARSRIIITTTAVDDDQRLMNIVKLWVLP